MHTKVNSETPTPMDTTVTTDRSAEQTRVASNRRRPGRRWLVSSVGPLLAVAVLITGAHSAVGHRTVAAQEGASGLGDPEDYRRLIVTVHTRNNNGRVFCALWRGPEGYPTDQTRTVGEAIDRTIVNNRAVCVFNDVEPGEHAVASFHDENGNNDLDTNFLGIPSEGTGASSGEHNMFGPPRYSNARFTIPDVQRHRIEIRIRY